MRLIVGLRQDELDGADDTRGIFSDQEGAFAFENSLSDLSPKALRLFSG
jgi:hypothetical protein